MTTPATLGFVTPTGDDYLREGDNAIAQNATAAAAMYDALKAADAKVLTDAAATAATEAAAKYGGLPARTTKLEREQWQRGSIAIGTNLDTLYTPGVYRLSTSSNVTGLPAEAAGTTGMLEVINVDAATGWNPWAVQTVHIYGATPQVWHRISRTTAGGWNPWRRLDAPPPAPPAPATGRDAGPYRHHDLLTRARHRRGGAIHTGKATVALRFDHHLDPFMATVLPLLRKYNLPWAQAVNHDRIGSYPTDLTTTWAQLQQACLDYGGEVWNHSATHTDATTEQALTTEIVGGLASLRAKLPLLPIEGWAPPGVGDNGYLGASPFDTTERNTETVAGQLIMGHHAFIAGYSNELYRVLDGVPPIGAAHYTLDAATPAAAATHLDNAQERDAGFAFMLHPNMVGAADKISAADLETIFADIAARRDAGTLDVVSYSGLHLAHAGPGPRHDMAPKTARSTSTAVAAGNPHTVTISTYGRGHLLGAPREIRLHIDAAAAGTLTLAVTGRPASTHPLKAGPNTIRRPITPALGSANLSITATPSAAGTVTGLNLYAI